LHLHQAQFKDILETVLETELNMYHDLALLQDLEAKNERTKQVLLHSANKISVVEESQKFIINMLTDLENELTQFASMTK
jgi:hypothetical protein